MSNFERGYQQTFIAYGLYQEKVSIFRGLKGLKGLLSRGTKIPLLKGRRGAGVPKGLAPDPGYVVPKAPPVNKPSKPQKQRDPSSFFQGTKPPSRIEQFEKTTRMSGPNSGDKGNLWDKIRGFKDTPQAQSLAGKAGLVGVGAMGAHMLGSPAQKALTPQVDPYMAGYQQQYNNYM